MRTSQSEPAANSLEDLDVLLARHRKWLDSEGLEGSPLVLGRRSMVGADLTGAKLQRANLAGGQFRNAVLAGADLSDTDLTGANFQGADLSRADLRRAIVRDTNFHDVSLVSADLSEAEGLLAGQLSGSNLAGSKMPANVGNFEGLANVAEASKMTQNLFASILLVCSYTWLTIASTTDPQLLNNAAPPSSRLPMLGTDIPLVRFYLVAPLLLLCIYIYFHLCLQRLWEELAELPAVFPDGRPLDKKAYPWLMNVVVRAHLPRLRADRSNLSKWQARMSILMAWGMVPLTILFLWIRYLRSHESLGTMLHVVLLAAAVGAGVGFLYLATTTLKGSEKRPFLWKKAWVDARARSLGAGFAALFLFGMFSYGAIEGVDPDASERAAQVADSVSRFNPRRFVPPLLAFLGIQSFAQLDDASVSTKPADWNGSKDDDLKAVKGADVAGRNLRHASAYNAFLVNSYLMKVDARGCDFREADLRGSDLRSADLRGANFRSARLEGADFRYSDLTNAKITGAQLAKANMKEAIMTDVQARDAKMAGAVMTSVNLRGADLTGADLQGVDLTGADLTGTILAGTDMSNVLGLTQSQIDVAIVDTETKLPAGLQSIRRVAVNQK